jgi:hypothetical protein
MKFAEWLNDQQSRQDPIGELARTPGMWSGGDATSRRKPDEHKVWADIVIRSARPGHIAVFNTAWQEFLQARKATEGFAD